MDCQWSSAARRKTIVRLLVLYVAFGEFEPALIRERQREGIVLANDCGVCRRRKRDLSPDGLADARRRIDAGDKKARIARELGICSETLYQDLFTQP